MHSCRQVSELVSKSLDSHLSLRDRLAVGFHLMLCRHCSHFKKQSLFLRQAGGRYMAYLGKVARKKSV